MDNSRAFLNYDARFDPPDQPDYVELCTKMAKKIRDGEACPNEVACLLEELVDYLEECT